VHAAVHVREMRGEIAEGIHFLESRRGDWATDNTFAFHNWWHLGLFHLDRGDTARVLEIYDQFVYPADTDFALILVDATAMLWRLQLLGVDIGDRFERVANAWAAKLDGEHGFYAFNDVHAILAFAGTQRQDAMARVLAALETPIPGTNGMMVRDVGLPLARAIVAFSAGNYSTAADQLAGVRDIANRFGGSHAQRDLITLTIIEAALRSGHKSMARHYLNERAVHRPGSALGWRLQARLA
jgi:hypothetical protein